jgi:hypothetical protein
MCGISHAEYHLRDAARHVSSVPCGELRRPTLWAERVDSDGMGLSLPCTRAHVPDVETQLRLWHARNSTVSLRDPTFPNGFPSAWISMHVDPWYNWHAMNVWCNCVEQMLYAVDLGFHV